MASPPAGAGEETFFVVPKGFASYVGEDPIPFFKPTRGHTLTAAARFAVRSNEKYKDVKALIENERAYVRRAIFHAQQLYVYYVFGKNPIIVIGNFQTDIIKEEGRAIDAAVKRAIEVRPVKTHRMEIPLGDVNRPLLYRICGKTQDILHIEKTAKHDMFFTHKEHHVQGITQAHAYIKPSDDLKKLYSKFMFEEVENIITSNKAAFQITARNETATIDEIFKVAEKLQHFEAKLFLRTHGTLRITLPYEVTTETVLTLQKLFNDKKWRIFTDTPINIWKTPNQTTINHKKTQDPDVAQALKNGIVVKISADYIAHPSRYEAIASSIGGSLIRFIQSKFEDIPQAALISIPSQNANQVEELLSSPFSVEPDGLFCAVRVGGKPSV
jgi:hypothetical protein